MGQYYQINPWVTLKQFSSLVFYLPKTHYLVIALKRAFIDAVERCAPQAVWERGSLTRETYVCAWGGKSQFKGGFGKITYCGAKVSQSSNMSYSLL